MSDTHASALRHSLQQAQRTHTREELGDRMFEIFFTRFPETRKLFENSDVESFGQVKFRLVSDFIVDCVRNPEYALYTMASEIYRHDYLDVRDQDYFNGMIDACHEAVRQALGDQYTPELAGFWAESCEAAKATIQEARRKVRK